jgi:hypothetical protein
LGAVAALALRAPIFAAILLGAAVTAGMLLLLFVVGPRLIDAVCKRNARALIQRIHRSGALPPR